MARLPRPDIAGVPQHMVQRGNNRLPCFLDDEDRQRYLQCLKEALLRYGCALHAYVLMSNHVHLLVTPPEAGVLSRMMQMFARNYAGLFNGRHGRTGTLWEGRYKACLVDSDGYVLVCSRYIELNPVRAWMVSDPSMYPWSSYAANGLGKSDSLVSPHAMWLGLGHGTEERTAAYRAQQRAWGTDHFQAQVEARLKRFAGVRPAHRPRRQVVQ